MPKKYSYNKRSTNVARCFKDACHIPAEWRDTDEREAIFRKAMVVEVSPLTLEVFAAWVWVGNEQKDFFLWVPGSRWRKISGLPRGQLGQFLLPPVDELSPALAGHGRGWGIYSDVIIQAADALVVDADA